MYFALGATLALAGFFLLNACLSLGAHFAFHLISRLSLTVQQRARLLFLLRVLPAAVSLLCALFLIVPSYFVLEPRATSERLSLPMLLFASFALYLLIHSAAKAMITWRIGRVLLRNWLRKAHPIALPGISIPAYRLEATCPGSAFPVIAVIGAFRPLLFVSAQVFNSLTQEEMAATLQHEVGHLAAHDNLKRLLARSSPAAFSFLPGAAKFARMWHAASEECADLYAVQQGRAAPLALASALIKVSRMVPSRCPAASLSGAYFLERDDLPGVSRRVHLLLEAAEFPASAMASPRPMRLMLVSGLVVASLLALFYPTVLAGVHELLENFLHLLS